MKPPLLMRALLLVVAGEAEAECVAGDLEEEFGQSSRSRCWYISQVTRSLLPLLLLRVRSGELSRILLGAGSWRGAAVAVARSIVVPDLFPNSA